MSTLSMLCNPHQFRADVVRGADFRFLFARVIASPESCFEAIS
jgi:hypothetical protein